jgi:hypothetical protein
MSTQTPQQSAPGAETSAISALRDRARTEAAQDAAKKAALWRRTRSERSFADVKAALDALRVQHGLDRWDDGFADQDALYDFGGVPK